MITKEDVLYQIDTFERMFIKNGCVIDSEAVEELLNSIKKVI